MEKNPKQVAVELKTAIDDNGEMEYNTVRATGRFFQKAHMDVLAYEETPESGPPIKNMVTIYSDRVTVKRTGHVNMHQHFREHKTSENVFQHPHGNIHMETLTHNITYRTLSDHQPGVLTIDYSVKLNGQEERSHHLTLTIQHKEDSR